MTNDDMPTRATIEAEWKAAYEKVLPQCPIEFYPALTEVLFAAQRAMNATYIIATAEAYKTALQAVRGNGGSAK